MRSAKMRMIAGRPTLIAAVLLHQAVQAQTEQQYALCFESTERRQIRNHWKF
jgi:hypothetical protein